MKTKIISAVCTLVNEDGSLNADGMARHITNQWDSGIAGIV